MRRALLCLALLAGCDTRVSLDKRVQFALQQMDEQVNAAAKGDPTFPCAAVRQELEELAGERVVETERKRARDACRQALLAFAGQRVAAASARNHAPLVAECVDLDRAMSLLAAFAPGDATAAGLERRRKALCQ